MAKPERTASLPTQRLTCERGSIYDASSTSELDSHRSFATSRSNSCEPMRSRMPRLIASLKGTDWRRLAPSLEGINGRRIAHSFKVGLALALVSLSVLLQDVAEKVGNNVIWAILTVVVVFEYTVGATLSKGLNRGLGTISAAVLGLGVDYVGTMIGPKLEPFFVGCSVFFIGAAATYTRFVPRIKAKYDYGVVIFLLTFCLVVISGYGSQDSIDLAFDRMATVIAGSAICVLVSVFIFPIWAGDDLYELIISNAEDLAGSIEDCLIEYFQGAQKLTRLSSRICKGQPYDDKIYNGYRGALISKQAEESLATFAHWEPRLGRLGCMHPWRRLVEVGAVLRHCAYTVSALHCCLLSEIQAPESLRKVLAEPCTRIGMEVGRVLREIAEDTREGHKSRAKEYILEPVNRAVERLQGVIKTHPHLFVNSGKGSVDDDKKLQIMTGCISQTPTRVHHHPNASSPLNKGILISPNHNRMSVYSREKHWPSSSFDRIQPSHGKFSSLSFSEVYNSRVRLPEDATDDESLSSHQSISFAESLSLASIVSMLIELVARLDHLLNAVARFQEEAGFKTGAGHELQSTKDGDENGDYIIATEAPTTMRAASSRKHQNLQIATSITNAAE